MLPRGSGHGRGRGRGRGGRASLLHVEDEEYGVVEVVLVEGKLLLFEKSTSVMKISLGDIQSKIR